MDGFEAKTFEVRDRMTLIPALAIRIEPRAVTSDADRFLVNRAGYRFDSCVLLTRLGGGQSCYDPYEWQDSRTMGVAHQYIIVNWDRLESGCVVDVEFIHGETTQPKISEREGAI